MVVDYRKRESTTTVFTNVLYIISATYTKQCLGFQNFLQVSVAFEHQCWLRRQFEDGAGVACKADGIWESNETAPQRKAPLCCVCTKSGKSTEIKQNIWIILSYNLKACDEFLTVMVTHWKGYINIFLMA